MTQYIVRMINPVGFCYVHYFIHDDVHTTEYIHEAYRFDSMTAANIFAITNNLNRYTVLPVESVPVADLPILVDNPGGAG